MMSIPFICRAVHRQSLFIIMHAASWISSIQCQTKSRHPVPKAFPVKQHYLAANICLLYSSSQELSQSSRSRAISQAWWYAELIQLDHVCFNLSSNRFLAWCVCFGIENECPYGWWGEKDCIAFGSYIDLSGCVLQKQTQRGASRQTQCYPWWSEKRLWN